MTNTIFFYHIFRDDLSSTSTSSTDVSQIDMVQERGKAIAQGSSSSLYTAVKALSSWTRLAIKPNKDVSSTIPSPSEGEIFTPTNSWSFIMKQFEIARNNLDHVNLLGEGRFGKVYRRFYRRTTPGTTMAIAVKVLFFKYRPGWLDDVKYLEQLSHPNLVKLHGHFLDREQGLLLVNEFIAQGSLENHLFSTDIPPLAWSLRVKVALGAARGLAFLHSGYVMYRDFKISDILLDTYYNAKLSDFGLAKDVVQKMFYWNAKLSDVYSFGVVLLELLSGRRAVELKQPSEEGNLVDWAKTFANNKSELLRLVDSRLKGRYPLRSAQKVAKLAVKCLTMEAKFRPNMDKVVKTLEKLHESQDYKLAPNEQSQHLDEIVITVEQPTDYVILLDGPTDLDEWEYYSDAAEDSEDEYLIGR